MNKVTGKVGVILRRTVIISGILTLLFLGSSLLTLALSNGDANIQRVDLSLAFPILVTLCVVDAVSFLGLLMHDIFSKDTIKNVDLWPYLVVGLVVASFLMASLVLLGEY